ncbi:hypothetical protein ACFL59_14605 [Planctomycetota bacterium]
MSTIASVGPAWLRRRWTSSLVAHIALLCNVPRLLTSDDAACAVPTESTVDKALTLREPSSARLLGGRFFDVLRFVRELERHPTFVRIEALRISAARGNDSSEPDHGPPVDVELLLSAFFYVP